MMIRAIAFDMGSVYVYAPSMLFYKEAAKYFGISAKEMKKAFHEQRDDFQKGKIKESKFWEQFADGYGKKADMKVIRKAWKRMTDKMRVDPSMEVVVRKLKKKYTVGVISNTVEYHYNFIKRKGWYKPFKPVICSCKVGYRKPEKKIYKLFLQKAKVKASETVFVDDKKECVDGARRVGMKAILFENAQQLRRELVKLGVEI
ncbi:MAG: HAD family hydrolase [Candidatus Aenigmatarchaeota archaeon]